MKIDLDSSNIKASDVFEAVEIAEHLKKEGISDIFRGQNRNFSLQPSIFRANVNRDLEVKRLNRFYNWVHSVAELKSLHGNLDQIMGVAQHYGFKTTFLDFTYNPHVAGFFASSSIPKKSQKKDFSCIICANRRAFEESWLDLNLRSKKDLQNGLTRIIDIQIQNLWRIESQQGLFLDIHVEPNFLEMFSFFRRIIFPYTGVYTSVSSEQIYPINKSHLEILLEEFFSLEERRKSMEEIKKIFGEPIYSSKEKFWGNKDAFILNELPPMLLSWSSEKLIDWQNEPKEKYDDVQTDIMAKLTLIQSDNIIEFANYVKIEILTFVEPLMEIRSKSIKWIIQKEDGSALTIDDETQDLLEDETYPQIEAAYRVAYLWDGLRRLPYTNEQIAECISNFLAIAIYGYEGISKLFGRSVGVEFSSETINQRAAISNDFLLSSIRKDFMSLLVEKKRKVIEESSDPAYDILAILVDPRRLFEFQSFADLFVKQIVPIQPYYIGVPIIFSPARIDVFGIS